MSTDRQVVERRLRSLESENQRLKQVLASRPRILTAGAGLTENVLQILDGQTVYNVAPLTLYGITRGSSLRTTVSSLWDPSTGTDTPGSWSCSDGGIGRAILWLNGVSQGYVLVCHDNRAGNLLGSALVQYDPVATFQTTSLTLATDSTQSVTAYIPTTV